MILPPLWRSLLRTRPKQNRSQSCVLRKFSGCFLPDPSHDRRIPGSTCAPAPALSRLPLPPFPSAAGLSTPAPRPPLRLPAAPPAPAPPRPARRTLRGAQRHLLEGRRHLRGTGGDPRPTGSSAGGRRGAPARRRAASPAALAPRYLPGSARSPRRSSGRCGRVMPAAGARRAAWCTAAAAAGAARSVAAAASGAPRSRGAAASGAAPPGAGIGRARRPGRAGRRREGRRGRAAPCSSRARAAGGRGAGAWRRWESPWDEPRPRPLARPAVGARGNDPVLRGRAAAARSAGTPSLRSLQRNATSGKIHPARRAWWVGMCQTHPAGMNPPICLFT